MTIKSDRVIFKRIIRLKLLSSWAVDSTKECSQALDMLCFKKQIIFSTLSAKAPFSATLDTHVKYGAVRAHMRDDRFLRR